MRRTSQLKTILLKKSYERFDNEIVKKLRKFWYWVKENILTKLFWIWKFALITTVGCWMKNIEVKISLAGGSGSATLKALIVLGRGLSPKPPFDSIIGDQEILG